ncbi:MAG: HAD-IB family phosphatase [Gemmatimonadales bacterium]
MTERGFASVVLDVDSTLCGIEGIDWLSGRRGADVGAKVKALTDRAMRGEVPLAVHDVERLRMVNPNRDDIAALATVYQSTVAPDAVRVVRQLHDAGRRVVLVSGGIREAILPLATSLGVADGEVHAVSLTFSPEGVYAGYDRTSPLTTSDGKRVVVESLKLPRRVVAVGDGATDLAMRPAVDLFAAFTGFARRAAVVAGADVVIDSFDQLVELVLA